MLKIEAKNTVFKVVSDLLKSTQFKAERNREQFTHYFEGGFYRLGYGIINYNPFYKLNFAVSLRIDKFEQIVDLFYPLQEQQNQSATIIKPICGNYDSKTKTYYYGVTSSEGVNQALENFSLNFRSEISGFIKKFSDFCELEKELNDFTNVRPNQRKVILGLIVAKAINIQNFDQLVDNYRKLAERYPIVFQNAETGIYPKKIRDLLEYLEKWDQQMNVVFPDPWNS